MMVILGKVIQYWKTAKGCYQTRFVHVIATTPRCGIMT